MINKTSSYKRDDVELKSLRPILQFNNDKASELEIFQNDVLRPIIKMQHELINSFINYDSNYSKLITGKVNYDELSDAISTFIKKNAAVKNQLIGMIISMMTTVEFEAYYANKAVHNKRITSIVTKRIVDTQYEKVRIEY